MPTTIYDSSLLTKRIQNKTIANSFINRIQNGNNSTTGSAPILGITDQSIINSVKTGQMTDFRKNDGGCVNINTGCPCNKQDTAIIELPIIEAIKGWATSIGGISNDIGQSITTDSFGNVYVTGRYNFDPETLNPVTINNFVSNPNPFGGTIIIEAYGILENAGSSDAFIVKYNSSGQVQWATSIGGNNSESEQNIITDSFGNVYVTGSYNSNPITINNFVSNPLSLGGAINITPYGTLANANTTGSDVFIVKYNSSGQAQWGTSIGGTSNESGRSIAIDSFGNVYVTGEYDSNPVTINNFVSNTPPLGGAINITPYGTLANANTSGSDVFIVKYNSSGQAQWATSIGGTFNEFGFSITTDSFGNVYVTGSYNSNPVTINNFVSNTPPLGGAINITPYGTLANVSNIFGIDAFIVKYNSSGQAQWATSIGGTSNDIGRSIATDSFGNIYVTGQYFSPLLTINNFVSNTPPLGGAINITPYGTLANANTSGSDVFIVKYNSSGQVQWATSIGGNNSDIGQSIITDSFGNVYVTGSYNSNPVTINNFVSNTPPLGGAINITPYGTLANANTTGSDVFIVKYTSSGQAQWATSIGGTSNESGRSIAIDSFGNVYVTGEYSSPLLTINNFLSNPNPSGGSVNITPYGTLANANTFSDAFIVKYNSSGQVL